MNKQLVILSIVFLPTMALSQNRLDPSERGQFGQEGLLRGAAATGATPSISLALGAKSSLTSSSGFVKYSYAYQGWTYIGSGSTGRKSSGANSMGASFIARFDEDNSKGWAFSYIVGFDHAKPSSNDGYVSVSLGSQVPSDPDEQKKKPLSYGFTGTYMNTWDGGAKKSGAVGDFGATFDKGGKATRWETGYTAPSQVAGAYDYFIRASTKINTARLRLKYGRGDVWTLDAVIKF